MEAFGHSIFMKDLFKTKEIADQDFIKQCLENIYENVEEESFNLNSLSEKMNLSRSSLYRKIRELTNIKPVDFLKKAKLNYAAKLLLNDRLTTNEIAWRSGFSDAKYFSKCSSQEFGSNPSIFKNVFLSEENVEA